MTRTPSSAATATRAQRALIVEGGALRSVFSAGVLDGFLRRRFKPFGVCYGVSAGACNLLAYLMGVEGVSRQLYSTACSSGLIDYRRFLGGGDLIDLDGLVAQIFNRYGADLADLPLRQPPLVIATTDVDSGSAQFLQATADNLRPLLTATMALPLLQRRFPILNGRAHSDGGIAANIPLAEAISRGATQILLIRSRPQGYRKRDTLAHRWIRYQLRAHPQLVATLQRRVVAHQQVLALLQSPPAGVHIVDICPPPQFRAGRFSRDDRVLQQGYEAGLRAAGGAIAQWQQLPAIDTTGNPATELQFAATAR